VLTAAAALVSTLLLVPVHLTLAARLGTALVIGVAAAGVDVYLHLRHAPVLDPTRLESQTGTYALANRS
jgi:hypothetical protein